MEIFHPKKFFREQINAQLWFKKILDKGHHLESIKFSNESNNDAVRPNSIYKILTDFISFSNKQLIKMNIKSYEKIK